MHANSAAADGGTVGLTPPQKKRPAAAVRYSRGSKAFPRFSHLRVAALRVGARIAGQFQNKLRLCGAGVLRTYSFPFFSLWGGRLVRPSRKTAEECLRLVSRRPALDARGIDVGWLA